MRYIYTYVNLTRSAKLTNFWAEDRGADFFIFSYFSYFSRAGLDQSRQHLLGQQHEALVAERRREQIVEPDFPLQS